MQRDPAIEPIDTPDGDSPPMPLDVPALQEELRRTRSEAASYRIGNKGRLVETGRALAKMAGVDLKPDQVPDLDDLLKRLDPKPLHEKIRGLTLDVQLERAYARHGLKPTLTRAYMADSGAMDLIRKLDPASENFMDDLDNHIREAADTEPALRGQNSTVAARTSSAPFKPQVQKQMYSRADLQGMSGDDVLKLATSGQIEGLPPVKL